MPTGHEAVVDAPVCGPRQAGRTLGAGRPDAAADRPGGGSVSVPTSSGCENQPSPSTFSASRPTSPRPAGLSRTTHAVRDHGGAFEARVATLRSDLVEPARSTAYDELGDSRRAATIAMRWLAPKLG